MGTSDQYNNAKLIQQSYFEQFEGRDWAIFQSNEIEHKYLKRNVGFALFGPPTENTVLGYSQAQSDTICKIYTAICNNHYLENTDELYIRIIYIYIGYKNDEEDGCLPLFIVKKCDAMSEPCLMFIDHTCRVYEGWTSYLGNNKLPKCRMYCPKNGKYSGSIQINTEGEEVVEVELECHDSPACGVDHLALNITDTVGTTLSLSTASILAVSTIPAVALAPGVLIAAGVGGIAAILYSVGRSIHTLVDRSIHQQSISLADSESRGCWVNATMGVVSAGTLGASTVLTAVTREGALVGNATRIALNSLNIGSMVGSATNLGVTVYNFIEKLVTKDQITAMDVLQLSSSILFFQMSVVNDRTAIAIIQETDAIVLAEYEASLRSNRHRKIFNKIRLEATRLHGEAAGNAEITEGIKRIANPDEFFAGMVKINKDLNKMNANYTINADGKVVINNLTVIDPVEFKQMNFNEREVYLSASTPGPSSGIMTESQLDSKIVQIKSFCVSKTIDVVPKTIFSMCENSDSIALCLQEYCEQSANCILEITLNFMDQLSDEFETLTKIHPLVNPIVMAIQYVIEYIKRFAEMLHARVITAINKIFSDLPYYISGIVQSFKKWWKSQTEKYFSVPNVYIDLTKKQKKKVVCKSCKGHYYLSK